eukprot:gene11464-biopygen10704
MRLHLQIETDLGGAALLRTPPTTPVPTTPGRSAPPSARQMRSTQPQPIGHAEADTAVTGRAFPPAAKSRTHVDAALGACIRNLRRVSETCGDRGRRLGRRKFRVRTPFWVRGRGDDPPPAHREGLYDGAVGDDAQRQRRLLPRERESAPLRESTPLRGSSGVSPGFLRGFLCTLGGLKHFRWRHSNHVRAPWGFSAVSPVFLAHSPREERHGDPGDGEAGAFELRQQHLVQPQRARGAGGGGRRVAERHVGPLPPSPRREHRHAERRGGGGGGEGHLHVDLPRGEEGHPRPAD